MQNSLNTLKYQIHLPFFLTFFREVEIDHLHLPNTPEKRNLIKNFWRLKRQKVGQRRPSKHAQAYQSSRLSRGPLLRSNHRLLVYFLFLDAFPLKFIVSTEISAQSKIPSFFRPDFMASVSVSQLLVVLLYSDWRRVFWRENWIYKKPKTMKLWRLSPVDKHRFLSNLYHDLDCERFEPRSHFKRLSLIVRVNVVLNRTVVVDSDYSGLRSPGQSNSTFWNDLDCPQTPTLFAVSLSLAGYQTAVTYFSRRWGWQGKDCANFVWFFLSTEDGVPSSSGYLEGRGRYCC